MLCHYTIPGLKSFGEPGRIRTFDPLLKRQVLSSILATGPLMTLERETRLELAASSLADLRSSQLSYSRM
jgi:hypothetical protein